MIEVTIDSVRVSLMSQHRVVVLKEIDGDRYLPIWIGAPEASAIAYAQQGVTPPRPLTHDLIGLLLDNLGHTLEVVQIDALRDKVFYATLVIDGKRIECRPSDAIAVALRTQTPISVAEAVLDEAGIAMAPEEDDEVERFREFLDQVSPEDFEAAEGDAPPES